MQLNTFLQNTPRASCSPSAKSGVVIDGARDMTLEDEDLLVEQVAARTGSHRARSTS
jgi:hypothetical protein